MGNISTTMLNESMLILLRFYSEANYEIVWRCKIYLISCFARRRKPRRRAAWVHQLPQTTIIALALPSCDSRFLVSWSFHATVLGGLHLYSLLLPSPALDSVMPSPCLVAHREPDRKFQTGYLPDLIRSRLLTQYPHSILPPNITSPAPHGRGPNHPPTGFQRNLRRLSQPAHRQP